MAGVEPLRRRSPAPSESRVLVRRIAEEMQKDEVADGARCAGSARCPTRPSPWSPTARGRAASARGGETAEIVPEAAEHIFVRKL